MVANNATTEEIITTPLQMPAVPVAEGQVAVTELSTAARSAMTRTTLTMMVVHAAERTVVTVSNKEPRNATMVLPITTPFRTDADPTANDTFVVMV